MQFSTVLFTVVSLMSTISAQPVPEIEIVFITRFATVWSTVFEQAGATSTGLTTAAASSAASPAAVQTGEAPEDESPTSSVAVAASSTSAAANESCSDAVTDAPTATYASPSAVETQTSSTASSESSSSSGSSGSYTGEGTYYDVGLGACGNTNSDSDLIVAISEQRYLETQNGLDSNHNPICGSKIRVYYEGKTVDVTVVDSCVGCSYNDLDLSPTAFSNIADKDLGRIDITWEFL